MSQLIELKGVGKPVIFKKDEPLYSEDEAVTNLAVLYIIEGNVELVKKYTPIQKEIFLYGPGDVVGILEVAAGTRRFTTARSISEVQAVALSNEDFEKAIVGNLAFALTCIRILSRMLRQINERIKKLPEVGK